MGTTTKASVCVECSYPHTVPLVWVVAVKVKARIEYDENSVADLSSGVVYAYSIHFMNARLPENSASLGQPPTHSENEASLASSCNLL